MQNGQRQNQEKAVVIYHSKDDQIDLRVNLEKETVWLSLNQIAELFGRDKSAISRHIKNIFEEGELKRDSVVAKNATTGSDGKIYQVEYFNLDVIISVGYRVNSQKATHFRIWATKVLRDHLVKGYTFNRNRLQEKGLVEFEQAVKLIKNTIDTKQLTDQETKGLLTVITEYTNSWLLLKGYDCDQLPYQRGPKVIDTLTYEECTKAIDELRESLFPGDEVMINIFGQELCYSFEPIIKNLNQTFDGEALYPGIKEKAAHLLYFIIKDHPFVEGNKRIGSFLFLLFLAKNHYLYRKDGTKKIDDYTLVALALLIAESKPDQKDVLIRLIMSFLKE